jgi:hypothetical protein
LAQWIALPWGAPDQIAFPAFTPRPKHRCAAESPATRSSSRPVV